VYFSLFAFFPVYSWLKLLILLKPSTDHTPQSADASCLDEEEGGLPSPPMDEAALFTTPCISMRLSEVRGIELSVLFLTSFSIGTVILTNLDPILVLEICYCFEVLRWHG
jgi:hypothetical protein